MPMIFLLLAMAAIGHVVFWASIVNRLHAIAIGRHWIDAATMLCALAMGILPLAITYLFWQRGVDLSTSSAVGGARAAWWYIYFAACVSLFAAAHRLWLTLHPERRGVLHSNHTSRVDFRCQRGDLFAPGVPTLLGRIPGNQFVDLLIHEKRIKTPRMPAGCELRIVHLTDLHMSGRITKKYFEQLAEAVNALEPDLVLITGDLVECEQCLSWLPDTLGRLRAAEGVYFVLGNHDRRIDHQRLLHALGAQGLIHVGGTCRELTVRGTPVAIAGNELPWFGPSPMATDLPPRDSNGLPLRLLLAHTPDRFAWACGHDFDLVLAGHNHGGQVRLPLLGAILAPSLSGVRYASGSFRRGNTVLHVSRGTGGLTPFRWNCPPEIVLLVLE